VLKMAYLHPTPTTYDFGVADMIVNRMRGLGLRVRGNTLVWGIQNPAWLTQGQWTRASLLKVLHNYITTVVRHFRGRVAQWDVVNEPITDTGTFTPNVWARVIGPRYIAYAFKWAHEADPKAQLFLNDFGNDAPGLHRAAELRLLRLLRVNHVPIDGVGMQLHRTLTLPTADDALQSMHMYARLGLHVEITEMDLALPRPPSNDNLVAQAQDFAAMVRDCLDVAACTGVTFWGLDDNDRYRRIILQNLGAATLFSVADTAKPGYGAVARVLETDEAPCRPPAPSPISSDGAIPCSRSTLSP
jgi:endo-1,4-beta-xylanase